jgi:four helix bundle protein
MRRAAVSIASNIAEGAERNANTEFQYFIGIAKGSAAELRTQVYLAMDLGLIANEASMRIVEETKLLGAKLEALRRSLLRRQPPKT